MTPSVSETVPVAPRVAAAAPSRVGTAAVVVVTLLVLTAIGFGLYKWLGNGEGLAEPRKGRRGDAPLPVVVDSVRHGQLPIYVDALGTVTPLNTVTVRSRVDGQLMKVAYTEGQIIHEGDVLAEIDPRPYQVQLTQAQGQLLKDQAQLKNATADLERYTTVRETVSQQQIDTAQAAVAQYEGAIKIDQGAIDSANLQLTYCRITAPLTGKIGLRTVDVGNIVHASDTTGLAVITQLQPIAVVFNLPEAELPDVLTATRGAALLGVDVFTSDRSVRLASGKLNAIDNQIDATTATVRIKAAFDNADGLLYPNQFVNVRLLVKTLNDVVLAPTSALQRGPDSMYVYVVKSDKTVEMRPVTIGPAEGAISVIESGVTDGETVVTDGIDKLAPAMAVDPHVRNAPARPAPTTQVGA